MQRAKQLKNADQILRRLLSTLEYPYAMQQMLAAGDFQSVLTIYRRVQSLPVASGLRIVKRIVNRSDIIMFEMKQKIMSILLNPTPVLPVLGKLVKILHEMEDEENCRLILQQCYERQIQTFEDQIKNIVNKSCEEFMRAYMRGQEINLMNKDPTLRGVAGSGGTNSPKATTKKNNNTTNQTYLTNESNPPVRRKTAASIRFAATKRRQSQTNDTLNDAVRSLYDGLNDSLFDDEQQSGISSFDDYNGRDYQDNNDEDGDYDEMDELSDSGSVVSSGSGNSKGIYLKKSDEDGMYQDPHTDYSEYFCKKVRIKLTRQLIDAIDMWLPSVHRLLILLTSAPQQSAPPVKITATAATTTISSRKVSVALPNRALQTTYGRNQSVANQAKQLGDVLVACAEAIRGSILGFKGKYLSSYMNEMISKSIFSQDFMQNTLKEPHLSATVMEISEVYDVIETVLMDSNRTETTPNTNTFMNDDLDSVNFFGSTAYRDSIHMLRALAEDGENTIAKKTMEQLLAQALVLTSKATNKSDLMDLNSRGKSYFLEEDGLNGDDNKSKTIDDIVRQFELMTIKRLRRLVEVIRRPDWVATTVWDYIQRLFDRFISSLAMVAGASNDGKKGFEVSMTSLT